MYDLAIEVDGSGAAVRIRLRGELDILTAPILAEALGRLLIPGQRPVLIDLRELGFMDCAGLAVFLAAAAGGADRTSLGFVGASPNVRRVFELTGHAELITHATPLSQDRRL